MALTEWEIRKVEGDVNFFMGEIKRHFNQRHKGQAYWDAWSQACQNWHGYEQKTAFLWSKEFKRLIKSTDKKAVSDAILYLEVDPWYFRSGYLKEHLLTALKSADLSQRDKFRILECFKTVIAEKRPRRDFRYYCSLVAKLFTTDQLAHIAKDVSLEESPKARYFNKYLKQ